MVHLQKFAGGTFGCFSLGQTYKNKNSLVSCELKFGMSLIVAASHGGPPVLQLQCIKTQHLTVSLGYVHIYII